MNKLKIRLKELRLEKKKTQKEVAFYLGMVESAYANYEQGRTEPNIDLLIKISDYFNVSVDYLIGKSDY